MVAKTPRRTRQADESRRRILDAAFAIANEAGYEGTSVARVSQRSGLPVSSVYWHFGSKDGLMAAVISHSFEQWEAATMVREDVPVGSGLRDQLAANYRRVARSFAHSPEFWRLGLLLTLEQRVTEATARARFLEIRGAVVETVTRWWTARLDGAVLAARPDLPRLLARFSLAALDGLFVASQADAGWEFEAMADLLADALAGAAVAAAAVAAAGDRPAGVPPSSP